jgi:hypothetical protein
MTTTLETGRIQFGNRDIQFKVQRSPRRQTVGVIVDANGVTLNAPAQLEFSALEQIARTRAAWIVTKQRRLETLSAAPATVKQFESGESFRYLGRQYRLKRLKPNTPASAKLRGKHIEVHASDALEARALVETGGGLLQTPWYQRTTHTDPRPTATLGQLQQQRRTAHQLAHPHGPNATY